MRRRALKGLLVLAWAAWTVGQTAQAADLEVRATLDRSVVGLNDQFTLSVELSGSGASSIDRANLPEMNTFAAYLGLSTSQAVSFVNGRISSNKTLAYTFQATAVGSFKIGPVKVVYEGKTYQTEPIDIEVRQSSPSLPPGRSPQRQQGEDVDQASLQENLFLRAVPSKTRVYPNEPVMLSYKLYTRVGLGNVRFVTVPATTGFWVEEPKMKETPSSIEVVNGRQYQVYTVRKLGLSAVQPGSKTIAPLVLSGDVRLRRRSRDLFDSFFDDPFFAPTKPVSIRSEPVRIEVLPLPSRDKPEGFSGAVGQFRLSGTVDKRQVHTNEAVTFKLTLEGEGNIRTLPDPVTGFSPDFEKYPPKHSEQIDLQGSTVRGKRVYEYVLVPRVAGRQVIKPVRFSFFDPQAGKYRMLQTDEIAIDVARGSDSVAFVPSGFSKEEVRLIGRDIRYIKTQPSSFRRIGEGLHDSPGFWLVLLTPLVALAGAIVQRRHWDRLQGDYAYARLRRAGRAARKRLTAARTAMTNEREKEFYAEVSKALIGFLGDKLNIAEAGMISDEVQSGLRARGVSQEVIDKYFACLQTCDLKRFSPTAATAAEMQAFIEQAETAMSELNRSL
jgi:hypothetical protein